RGAGAAGSPRVAVRGGGAARAGFLNRQPGSPQAGGGLALAGLLAFRYGAGAPRGRPGSVWFALLVACWAVLVVLAPSFAWCAVPLLYTGFRILPMRVAVGLVVVLTGLVVLTQVRLAGWGDPNLLLAPPAVAAVTTALFIQMRHQTVRQAGLIDDLLRTRQELAATERREGTLAERQRLAGEIHDTVAQGLSSQRMLLQAADRIWDSDPARARSHVRTAATVAEQNLAEARRFVHDLAPADLAATGSLEAALRTLAERESSDDLTVRYVIDGTPVQLPGRIEATVLRIAQGALANIREHAAARTATVTLTYLDDRLLLDIADDGRGFDPAAADGSGRDRGYGLPAIRARLQQLGGTLTIESAPGEGAVLSAAIPLERA
ncbi:sensor histidine kinase, partial [Nocardia cyriacigeorgica]|uniref:sensor histidine kinase n=1 Tax=Nocardia cyriacigeorgica TaxID=135487 RepID=UPI0024561D91